MSIHTSAGIITNAHNSDVITLKWSYSGDFLASGGNDNVVKIWENNTYRLFREFHGHTQTVSCLAWNNSDTRIATGSADNTIKIWDVLNNVELFTLVGHKRFVRDLAWLNDETLISCSEDGVIYIWNAINGKLKTLINSQHGWALCLAVHPDGELFASSGGDGIIRIWTLKGNNLIRLRGHQEWVDDIVWSKDGRFLISASGDATIRIWDVSRKKPIQILEGHTEKIRSLALSHDGSLLASKSSDNTVRLWETENWTCTDRIVQINGSDYWPPRIDFHPKHLRLASLGDNIGDIWIDDINLGSPALTSSEDSVKYIAAKIVLVGESGVGKTGLGWRLSHDEFKEQASTHGQQFWLVESLKFTRKDHTECEAVLWDLAGQRDYRLTHGLFLDNVDVGLIVINPSDSSNPLKGVGFWLNLLKHKFQDKLRSILIGARIDRGNATYTADDLARFCEDNNISGGYLATSAMTGSGVEELIEKLKNEIAWEEKTVTTTTTAFRAVKEYILTLKQNNNPGVKRTLMGWPELMDELQKFNEDVLIPEKRGVDFSEEKIRTAISHLGKHGLLRILSGSEGNSNILLTPELLHNLASSIIMEARNNLDGLGAIDETSLRNNQYSFAELTGLSPEERKMLIDSVILLFIEKNIAFRERIGKSVLLIYPELINLKKPGLEKQDDFFDGRSYQIKGAIDNLYGAMVVLLGYTNILTRKGQWQDQAIYQFEENDSCGFRQINTTEGELEFILFYGKNTSMETQRIFQGLFEKFLAKRDITVTSLDPIVCPNCHYKVSREESRQWIENRRDFMFCPQDGSQIWLAKTQGQPETDVKHETVIETEERAAQRKTGYESVLSRLLAYMQTNNGIRRSPTCFISYAWGDAKHEEWVRKRFAPDLKTAGISIILDEWKNYAGSNLNIFIEEIVNADAVVIVGSPSYLTKYHSNDDDKMSVTATEMELVNNRLNGNIAQRNSVIPILRDGSKETSLPPLLRGRISVNLKEENDYYPGIFELLLSLFRCPLADPEIIKLRELVKAK